MRCFNLFSDRSGGEGVHPYIRSSQIYFAVVAEGVHLHFSIEFYFTVEEEGGGGRCFFPFSI